MKQWALVVNGVVTSVVEQSGVPRIPGTWVESTGSAVGAGSVWNGSVFSAPPAAVYTKIDTTAFWDRFTDNEKIAYDVAMQHDPAASTNAKNTAASLRVFRRMTSDKGYVVLSGAASFVASLEGLGVLSNGRAAQITGAAITPTETPAP